MNPICNSTFKGIATIVDAAIPIPLRLVETTTGEHQALRLLLPSHVESLTNFEQWCFSTGMVTWSGSEEDLLELLRTIDRSANSISLVALSRLADLKALDSEIP